MDRFDTRGPRTVIDPGIGARGCHADKMQTARIPHGCASVLESLRDFQTTVAQQDGLFGRGKHENGAITAWIHGGRTVYGTMPCDIPSRFSHANRKANAPARYPGCS